MWSSGSTYQAPSWFSLPAQALQAEKISKKQSTQSTMKCDVKEHLIQHKKILKKVRLSKRKKLNLNFTFSRRLERKKNSWF